MLDLIGKKADVYVFPVPAVPSKQKSFLFVAVVSDRLLFSKEPIILSNTAFCSMFSCPFLARILSPFFESAILIKQVISIAYVVLAVLSFSEWSLKNEWSRKR